MALLKKYNTVIINILLAVVVCLIINFSYLLAIREQERRDSENTQRMQEWLRDIENQPSVTGTLRISRDGYGYIVFRDSLPAPADSLLTPPADTLPAETADTATTAAFAADSIATGRTPQDSIYVQSRDIDHHSLRDGDILRVVVREARNPGANPVMMRLLDVNGEPFDYGERYDHPSDSVVMVLQILFYFVFAFILLTVMTAGAARNASVRFYLVRAAYCIAIAVVMWLLMPMMKPRSGELTVMAMSLGGGIFLFDIMIVKCSFVIAFALLYGRTYQLINQREGIMLENERLKSENLRARYNTLVGQINPHFLFNSLNSLSALVREGKSDDAVSYIDRLSDTFRYTIRHEPNATTTLGEELEFVGAYKYLLEVRYAEKLFVDIDVKPEKLGWMLPTFSIQPLVENAVKHNVITRAKPLRISIRTEGDRLVVSNPINPKIAPEKGTGIGLANLSHRWRLLTGRDIEVRNDGATFSVALPFISAGTNSAVPRDNGPHGGGGESFDDKRS